MGKVKNMTTKGKGDILFIKIKMKQEIKIIKEQINILLDSGYIFEVREGEYKGLGVEDDFYLKIEGGFKE